MSSEERRCGEVGCEVLAKHYYSRANSSKLRYCERHYTVAVKRKYERTHKDLPYIGNYEDYKLWLIKQKL